MDVDATPLEILLWVPVLHTLLVSWPIAVSIDAIWCTLSDPAQIVIRPNQTNVVDAGNTITFVCVAYGDPNPTISWNRGDTVLSNDSQITTFEELVTETGLTFVRSILVLCSAEEADAGQYNCFADNTLGNDTVFFVLTVNVQSKQNCIWNEYCSIKDYNTILKGKV